MLVGNLDKLRLVGKLDCYTPNFVIDELARWLLVKVDTHMLRDVVYRTRVIVSIQQVYLDEKFEARRRHRIDFFNPEHLPMMINFINPDPQYTWTYAAVSKSLDFINDALNYNKSRVEAHQVGFPTPLQPQRMSPLILYSMLHKKYGIQMHPEIGLKDMLAIYDNVEFQPHQLRHQIFNLLTEVGDHRKLLEILGVVSQARDRTATSTVSFPQLAPPLAASEVNLDLIPPDNVHELITPNTDKEAIGLALQYFKQDISRARRPKEEFTALKMKIRPIDPYMREIERLNRIAYDIRHVFNPNIPINFYDTGKLFTIAESFDIELGDNVYEDLTVAHFVGNFYLGVQHGVTSFSTIVNQEDVRYLDPLPPLVSYGSFETGYQIHLFSELARGFRVSLNFSNPVGGYFRPEAITRLKKLVERSHPRHRRSVRHRRGSAQVREVPFESHWGELLEAIDLVNSFQDSEQHHCRQLVNFYRSSNGATQLEIKRTLDTIMIMSMHMRGWNDPKLPWPIEIVPESDEANDTQTVYNVSRLHAKLERRLEKSETVRYVMNLPLLFFGENKFRVSSDTHEGLTLLDRFRIIKIGESDPNNVYTCIKSSSNPFVFSCHRYLTVIGFPPYFRPESLKIIYRG
jgi:hypothetical protein